APPVRQVGRSVYSSNPRKTPLRIAGDRSPLSLVGRRGRGHRSKERRVVRDLEHDARRSRRTTQRIRRGIALVFSSQPAVALKRYPADGTVDAAVHGLWGERTREDTADEYEILIL